MHRFIVFSLLLLGLLQNDLWAQALPYKKPNVQISYGFPELNLHNADKLKLDALYKLSVGLKRLKFTAEDSGRRIADYAEPYLFGSFAPRTNSSVGNTSFWNVGFGSRDGYAYRFQNANLTLFVKSSYSWSQIDINADSAREGYQRFSSGVKFGRSVGTGLDFQFLTRYSLGLGLEENHRFAAYVFPKSFTASFIQFALHKLSNAVFHPVISSNAMLFPVLHVLMHNAINFVLYELRQKNMYWPLKSEAPLVIRSTQVRFSMFF